MLVRIHAQALDEYKEAVEKSDSPGEKLISDDGEKILFVYSDETVLQTQHYTGQAFSWGLCLNRQ